MKKLLTICLFLSVGAGCTDDDVRTPPPGRPFRLPAVSPSAQSLTASLPGAYIERLIYQCP